MIQDYAPIANQFRITWYWMLQNALNFSGGMSLLTKPFELVASVNVMVVTSYVVTLSQSCRCRRKPKKTGENQRDGPEKIGDICFCFFYFHHFILGYSLTAPTPFFVSLSQFSNFNNISLFFSFNLLSQLLLLLSKNWRIFYVIYTTHSILISLLSLSSSSPQSSRNAVVVCYFISFCFASHFSRP